ncbi:MAG: PASTA domain-containing protein [Gammaproteobacteria bacterium]
MKIPRIANFIIGLALGLSMIAPVQALQHTGRHTFSIQDVQGDFQGSTFGGTTTSDGSIPADTTILCGGAGMATCPQGIAPVVDRKLYGQSNPITLYPIDSEFGYDIIDFLGAAQKTRDGDYAEGFIGDVPPAYFPTQAAIDGVDYLYNEDPVTGKYPPITGGVAISNAATDTYKVKPPLGTWCRGLGGNSVKCETEHYSVMEHILSCHEVIPYFNFDFVNNRQAVLNEGSVEIPALAEFDCADAGLDDLALILVGGVPGAQLVNGTPCEAVNDPVGCQIFPNDKTDVNNNVALTDDYSVQLKDDGKALYGWGTIHKRPNDVRLYASIPLPAAWKVPGANYVINSAKLVIRHHITNNPNDQLRPEDLENEAATGRKPAYRIEGTIGGTNEVWKSTKACFEGDSDLIDTEDGNVDPTFLGVGTTFKDAFYAITTSPPTSNVPTNSDLPYPLSSDLTGGFTNAWYTTVDRAPFEWSYDANPDPTIQDFVGSWLEDPTLGALVSGPRWRLRPNKYGQDLPGLEIAIEPLPGQGTDGADCYAPPFESALIKYPVGDPTITEINLLDWENQSTSPLAFSRGWIDVTQNGAVELAPTSPLPGAGGVPYTTNGLPMSDDFDLAVYIKGDRKPTAVYDAYLEIDYDVAITVPNIVGELQADADITLTGLGLILNVTGTSCSDTYPVANTVITQDPTAGSPAVAGDTVDVTLSDGTPCTPVTVPVPAIAACDTVPNATNTITGAGLIVNPVNITQPDACPAGTVISTVPTAGTLVAPGSQVTLVVSTGPVATVDVTAEWVRLLSPFSTNRILTIIYNVVNNDTVPVTGTATLAGSDGSSFTRSFNNLAPGSVQRVTERWVTPATPQTVNFTVTVTVNGVVTDTLPGSVVVQ